MTNPELSFKCRRCRFYLFGGESIVNTAGGLAGGEESATNPEITVWYINEGDYPAWIHDAIDQAQWTKGKLNCPKCQGRLGSFDFITPNKTQMGQEIFSPIQVVKARVDCEPAGSIIDQIKKISQKAVQNQSNLPSLQESDRCGDGPNNSERNAFKNRQPSVIISTLAEATASLSSGTSKEDDNSAVRLASPQESNALGSQGPITGQTKSKTPGSNVLQSHTIGCQTPRRQNTTSQALKSHATPNNFSKDHIESQQSTSKQAQSRTDFDVPDRVLPEECSGEVSDSEHPSTSRLPHSQTQVQSSSNRNVNVCTIQPIDRTCNQSNELNDSDSVETREQSPITPIENTTERGQRLQTEVDDSVESIQNPERTNMEFTEDLNEVADRIQILGTSFDGENSASWEEFFEEIMEEIQETRASSLSRQQDLDSSQENAELEDDEQGLVVSSNRLPGRERAALRRARNRRKKERRKQRRKEKWNELREANIVEQEPDLSSLLEVLGTDWSRPALQEVTTCSICLDVFYQPHSCVPCNHIFCEPCLRQLACVHPVVAPCPLCRTSIQTVVEHFELTAAIRKLFPTQVQRRKEAEKRTLHRSFPLPGHSTQTPITRPWFTLPRFRTSDGNERVRQFTNRVNRVRQRRQELNRTVGREVSGEAIASLMFFAVVVGVIVAFMSLMQEFA